MDEQPPANQAEPAKIQDDVTPLTEEEVRYNELQSVR